ncbi:hypothetical protein MNBD_BACTEROID01-2047 [hydrothermal vent metagenome]|uniref:Methyltransferase type 11 domain-containing protein n=1 Tax=hydrothermal vent metagenome TaxID=652676 RepID=A0A3B0U1E6_9ZZZZ
MEQLSDYIKKEKIKRVLDIGTGSGQFVKTLLSVFPGIKEIIAIDPVEDPFKENGMEFQGKNVTFLKMGAEKLDFQDESFDLVSISDALHHLPQLEQSLHEMKRVVKPEGWIIISELVSDNLNPAQQNQKFFHHLKSYTARLTGNFHHKTWKKQEILDIATNNGIKIEVYFEYSNNKSLITESKDIDFWVGRLKIFIDEVKGLPEYAELLPKVAEFRQRIEKDGMQHATNVVIAGRKI